MATAATGLDVGGGAMTEQHDSERPSRPRMGPAGEAVLRWLPIALVLASVIGSFVALKAEAGETQRRVDRLESIQSQVTELRGDVQSLTRVIEVRNEFDARQRAELERRLGVLEQADRERRNRER